MAKKAKHSFNVKRSRAGLGLFAESPIKKGDFVIEYTGKKLRGKAAEEATGKYLFDVVKGVVIDGKGRENTARYINHSCRPNCEAEVDEDEERIRIYALRNIKPGEELTYDYGKEYWNDFIKPHGCKCEKCRAKT